MARIRLTGSGMIEGASVVKSEIPSKYSAGAKSLMFSHEPPNPADRTASGVVWVRDASQT